jgi:hypothetical protein
MASDSQGMNHHSDILGWRFMGSAIVEATIHSLLKKGLHEGTQVLFTGTSAGKFIFLTKLTCLGAEGLYPNADRVANWLPKSNLRVLLDSGMFSNNLNISLMV